MPAIGLHDATYDKVRLLARAWSINEGEVVARLIAEFQRSDRKPAPTDASNGTGVLIHAVYEGIRVTGRFDPSTEAVTITSGDLAGQTYRSPSGAAAAQVVSCNPSVSPNRSGWSFWSITDTGELLQSLRKR